jgi:hypothetical protein
LGTTDVLDVPNEERHSFGRERTAERAKKMRQIPPSSYRQRLAVPHEVLRLWQLDSSSRRTLSE